MIRLLILPPTLMMMLMMSVHDVAVYMSVDLVMLFLDAPGGAIGWIFACVIPTSQPVFVAC